MQHNDSCVDLHTLETEGKYWTYGIVLGFILGVLTEAYIFVKILVQGFHNHMLLHAMNWSETWSGIFTGNVLPKKQFYNMVHSCYQQYYTNGIFWLSGALLTREMDLLSDKWWSQPGNPLPQWHGFNVVYSYIKGTCSLIFFTANFICDGPPSPWHLLVPLLRWWKCSS